MLWTPEKISTLPLQDVKNLAINAEAKGNQEVAALCAAELLSRKPKPKPIVGMPDGFIKVTRTPAGKRLEAEVAERLVALAHEVSNVFDLSAERARALSVGTQRFIPHRLLDSKGKAKTGGAQKAGRVVFDRYISYRVKEEMCSLLAILLDGEGEQVRYQVLGPAKLLDNFVPLGQLRPYLLSGESIGATSGGEEYATFDEGAVRFKWLLEQIAPKL
mgnify:FL=1|jgi:hypothetical protein